MVHVALTLSGTLSSGAALAIVHPIMCGGLTVIPHYSVHGPCLLVTLLIPFPVNVDSWSLEAFVKASRPLPRPKVGMVNILTYTCNTGYYHIISTRYTVCILPSWTDSAMLPRPFLVTLSQSTSSLPRERSHQQLTLVHMHISIQAHLCTMHN